MDLKIKLIINWNGLKIIKMAYHPSIILKVFFSENFFFKKKNKINSSNFFLSSTLSAGGGSKYWGSGLEIPDKYYYKRNKLKLDQFKNQIENSKIFLI